MTLEILTTQKTSQSDNVINITKRNKKKSNAEKTANGYMNIESLGDLYYSTNESIYALFANIKTTSV